jgi:LacI family transcriptional regulator
VANGGRSKGGVTIYDVAKHAGVGSMTVSRVINGGHRVSPETMARVQASIKALNYTPNLAARNTRSGHAPIRIGVLYSNPSAAYLNELMLGGLEESAKQGSQFVLETCDGLASQRTAVKRLLQADVDAILLPPPLCDNKATLDLIATEGVIPLAFATARPNPAVSAVRIDDFAGALAMTQRLLALGHTDIGFIKGDPLHTPTQERLQGFLKAMSTAGLDVRPDRLVEGKFTYRSGLAAARQLLQREDRPSAIFASNDDMAAAAVAVAHGLHLEVPKDLSVCGFDDTPVATIIWPQLTTVHQPVVEMGRAAVAILCDLVRAERAGLKPQPVQELMDFQLVERDSTAAPPAAAAPRRNRSRAANL